MKKFIFNLINDDRLYWITGGLISAYMLYHLALALINANI